MLELSPKLGFDPGGEVKVKISKLVPLGAISLTSRSPTQVWAPVKLTLTSDGGPVIPVTANEIRNPCPSQSPSGIGPVPVPGKTASGDAALTSVKTGNTAVATIAITASTNERIEIPLKLFLDEFLAFDIFSTRPLIH
jgi:hypothetical protein